MLHAPYIPYIDDGSVRMTDSKSDFLSNDVLEEMFADIFAGKISENKDIEFKKSFGTKSLVQYMKTMVGFANAGGGYLIFGVEDRDRTPLGLMEKAKTEFCKLDGEKISTYLRDHFNREVLWNSQTFTSKDLSFGVVYVAASQHKPVIATKDANDGIKKGAIYYRYHSQTTLIEPADLDRILEEEKMRYVRLILEKIQMVVDMGPENTAMVNLLSGDIKLNSGVQTNLVIDPPTLRQIHFIREGHFTEKEGAPALVLKGEIQDILPVDRVVNMPTPKSITDGDLYRIFLWQEPVESPDEFLRQVCFFRTANYPIYYLIQMSGKSFEEIRGLLDGIEEACAANIRSKIFKRIECLRENKTLYQPISDHSLKVGIRPERGTRVSAACRKKKIANMILAEKVNDDVFLTQNDNLKYFLMAVQTLSNEDIVLHLEYVFSLLQQVFNNVFLPSACDSPTRTEFRKAVCWVDEALYLKDVSSGEGKS